MIKAQMKVIINRPLEAVFAFVSNPENNLRWGSGMLEVEITSPGSGGLGATARTLRRFPGGPVEFYWKVIAYAANKLLVVNSTGGPLSMQARYEFDSLAEAKTSLRFALRGEAHGFLKLLEPVIALQAQQELKADFLKLKTLLESEK